MHNKYYCYYHEKYFDEPHLGFHSDCEYDLVNEGTIDTPLEDNEHDYQS